MEARGLVMGVIQQATAMQDGLESGHIPTESFSVDGVDYRVRYSSDGEAYYAQVRGFTDSNDARTELVIPDYVENPLDATSSFHVETVAEGAFMQCTSLKSVVFEGTMGGRIGGSAFAGCTSLASVTFADDCVLSNKGELDSASNGNPIGSAAFSGCTSLTTIEIPPLSSATRKDKASFTMDYMKWHGQDTPVAPGGAGLSPGVFTSCSSLRSVVFRAGHSEGAYAYFNSKSGYFENCMQLESIVFECRQSFWMNPDSRYAVTTGSSTGWDWEGYADSEDDYPTLYYAVDYYASEEAALEDARMVTPTCTHAARIGRVDYPRGTSLASIATNDASGYASIDGHAQLTPTSSAAPDAAQAAGHAGEKGWVWKFEAPFGYGDALLESCYAYPVKTTDLSGAHAQSSALEQMRIVANLYLEDWFDIERYTAAAGSTYASPETVQGVSYRYRTVAYTGDAAHTLLLSGDLKERIDVSAADGTKLVEGRDYERTFTRYDEATGTYTQPMKTPDGEGPYLMSLSGVSGSNCEGTSLEIWIRVKKHAVTFSMTSDIGSATDAATLTSKVIGTGSTYGNKAAPYVVLVDDRNPVMLYLGCAFAGFGGAVIVPTTNGEYASALGVIGTVLSEATTRRVLAVGVSRTTALEVEMNGVRVAPDRYDYGTTVDTASKLAAAAYNAFNRDRSRNGVKGLSWGSAAVVMTPDVTADCMAMAAYSYSMKAPVFFTEPDGSLSSATLSCLKDFTSVVVPGGGLVTPQSTVKALKDAGLEVTRIGADCKSQCDFSAAVADEVARAKAASYATVTMVAGCDPLYMTSALSTSGYTGGVVLVAGGIGDTKTIIDHLVSTERADELDRVYLMEPGATIFDNASWGAVGAVRAAVDGRPHDTSLAQDDVVSYDGALYQINAAGKRQFASRYATAGLAAVDISTAVVKGVKAKTFTGKALKQSPKVSMAGKALMEGTDYSLSYTNNVNAGTAKMRISGKGGYWGSLSKTFNIKKAAQDLKVTKKALAVERAKVAKGTVSVKPITVANARGSVSYKRISGSSCLSVKAGSGAVVVRKGTAKGTYKMKVSVIAKGTENYEKTVKNVLVKVKVK